MLLSIPFLLLYKYARKQYFKILFGIAFVIPMVAFLAPEIYQLFFYSLNINYYIPTNRPGVGKLFLLYFLFFIGSIVLCKENKLTLLLNKLFGKIDNKNMLLSKNSVEKNDINENMFFEVTIGCFSVGVMIYSFSTVCFSMLRLSNVFLLPATVFIPNLIYKQKSASLRLFGQLLLVFILMIVFYVDYYKINQLNGFPFSFL